jgi:hypothetical protein
MIKPKNDYATRIKGIDRQIENNFYGLSQAEKGEELDDINNRALRSLNRVNSYAITGNGPDIIGFLNNVMYNNTPGRTLRQTGRNGAKTFADEVESGEVNLMFDDEKNRFQRYRSIDSVCAMVPEISRVIIMQRDMIMSPNEFAGSDFIFEIKNGGVTDESLIEAKQESLLEIDKKYMVSDEIGPKVNSDIVKYGDAFVVVLNFQEEIDRLLAGKERTAHESALEDNRDLESSLALEAADVSFLNSNFNSYVSSVNEKRKTNKLSGILKVDDSFDSEKWGSEIDKFFNIKYSEDPISIIGEELEVFKEYEELGKVGNESGQIRMPGSILRHMEPNKVIKVEVGGVAIGYYYLDVIFATSTKDSSASDPYSCPACDLTYNNNRVYSFFSHMDSKGMGMNKKVEILSEIFAKRIGGKLNRKFIAKNTQFKDFIYTILKTNKAIESTSVIFMKPDDVVHFKRGSRVYGESIIDPVLYFAKLYTVSLLSAIMQQVLQGKDKQVYYVEQGLDEDSEGAVQSFISDLKQREITIDDFSDVTGIFNRITKSNCMVIPTIDGKKAIEFDTFAGQEASISNDFLEFLKKSIISGMGYPSSWLDSSGDVEFATTLVQQNANVLKLTTSYQKIVNSGFTKLFRKLVKNEDSDKNVMEFEVSYPVPTMLDNRKTEEEMTRVQGIADFIILTLLGENPNETDESAKASYKREIIKKLMSQIDWVDYEEILRKCRDDVTAMKLKEERDKAEEEGSAEQTNTEGGEEKTPEGW